MKIYSIYKATNRINGKSYIGFDSKWPKRLKCHKRDALVVNQQFIFYKAIRKYGWGSFDWEVICQSKDGDYLKNVMEPYFIEYYDTFGINGYNMTKGGEGALGRIISDETRKKMSDAQKGIKNYWYGKKQPKEMNILKSLKTKGKKKSLEHIEKIRKSHIGKIHTQEAKDKMSNSKSKEWIITYPNGIEQFVKGLPRFCKNLGLNPRILSKGTHKGYKARKNI